jgi:hypothetical protein
MNPANLSEQLRRAWAIAKRISESIPERPGAHLRGFMPVVMFLAFLMGGRDLRSRSSYPGLSG